MGKPGNGGSKGTKKAADHGPAKVDGQPTAKKQKPRARKTPGPKKALRLVAKLRDEDPDVLEVAIILVGLRRSFKKRAPKG